MTSVSELVGRLQEFACTDDGSGPYVANRELVTEAADRLEAQAAEIARKDAALRRVGDWLQTLDDCDLGEIVADGGITAGMVVQQEAREQARRIRAALAAGDAKKELP